MESIAFSWKCVKWYWPCFLLIASGVVWFVFFMKAIQRRKNLKETDKKNHIEHSDYYVLATVHRSLVVWIFFLVLSIGNQY